MKTSPKFFLMSFLIITPPLAISSDDFDSRSISIYDPMESSYQFGGQLSFGSTASFDSGQYLGFSVRTYGFNEQDDRVLDCKIEVSELLESCLNQASGDALVASLVGVAGTLFFSATAGPVAGGTYGAVVGASIVDDYNQTVNSCNGTSTRRGLECERKE